MHAEELVWRVPVFPSVSRERAAHYCCAVWGNYWERISNVRLDFWNNTFYNLNTLLKRRIYWKKTLFLHIRLPACIFWISRYMALGIALRYVLEALKKQHASKMYYFGLAALDRFKTRYEIQKLSFVLYFISWSYMKKIIKLHIIGRNI